MKYPTEVKHTSFDMRQTQISWTIDFVFGFDGCLWTVVNYSKTGNTLTTQVIEFDLVFVEFDLVYRLK
jgi:hypothetical protein